VTAPPLAWSAPLAWLRGLCAAEEVASTLRHEALNELAGIGALLFRLRRRLEADRAGVLPPEVLKVFEAIDARFGAAPDKFGGHFLPPPRPGLRAELRARALAAIAGLGLPATVGVGLDEGAPLWAGADGDELEVAIACLLENAVQAITTAGAGAVTVRCSQQGQNVSVEVSDDAEVIPEERAERMLDPFFSSRPGRPGLGLKIARRVAQRWGGELLLSPGAPRGLCARLSLPAL
jgi:signal transduction histidine kinase